jgi:uncharacterized repeat protein (TIGR03987 family)
LLIPAVIAVSLALILYTTAVWREFFKNEVQLSVIVIFWAGFFFDLLGTALMSLISKGFAVNVHTVIGTLALFLMAGLGGWLSYEYAHVARRYTRVRRIYGLCAWCVWVVVFVAGSMQ